MYTIPTTSVGSFFIRRKNGSDIDEKPVKLCLKYYKVGLYDEASEKIQTIDPTIKTGNCKIITFVSNQILDTSKTFPSSQL